MKKLPYVLILLSFACEKEKNTLPPCELQGTGWVLSDFINNVETVVKKDSLSRYVFIDPGKRDIIPCNLPASFQIEGTRVLFSGQYYSHPLMDLTHYPFQISTLQRIE